MKQLDIPYIGVKIESLPTMLRLIQEDSSNDAFISYYKKLGKKEKTASEYLRSLINLKLAKKAKKGETQILPAGISLIEDDVELLYKKLKKHCLKHFPDLKLILNLMKEKDIKTKNDLVSAIEDKGFYVSRPQTISSYYKILNEAAENFSKTQHYVKNHEVLEYNQFLKMFHKYTNDQNNDHLSIKDFFIYLNDKSKITRELLTEYFSILRRNQGVKLIEVNSRLVNGGNDHVNIGGRDYYYFERLKNE